MKKILRKAKFIISFAHFSCLLPDGSAGRIARELRWTSEEFSSADIIPSWYSLLIRVSLAGMNNKPVAGLSSET
jgi:hypothetical protein